MFLVKNPDGLFFAGTKCPVECHPVWGWTCPVWERQGDGRVHQFAREDAAQRFAVAWDGEVVEE